jgi:son of sevenless-like protein
VDLTSAERLAQSLQHALTLNSPELVTDMSEAVRREILTVLEFLQSPTDARHPEDDTLDRLVDSVVVGVRNLLYISAAPSHITPNLLAQEP